MPPPGLASKSPGDCNRLDGLQLLFSGPCCPLGFLSEDGASAYTSTFMVSAASSSSSFVIVVVVTVLLFALIALIAPIAERIDNRPFILSFCLWGSPSSTGRRLIVDFRNPVPVR